MTKQCLTMPQKSSNPSAVLTDTLDSGLPKHRIETEE